MSDGERSAGSSDGGRANDGTGAEPTDTAGREPLVSLRDVEKHYPVRSGVLRRVTGHVRAVDGVSFDVYRGETFGLVGESGCGKSTTASLLVGVEEPTGGEISFDGQRVTELSGAANKSFRRRAQMVFQDPTTAFDPRLTIRESLREPLTAHGLTDEDRATEMIGELLSLVGLSPSDATRYPQEFSDGQTQRIALARALILDPDLLIADEPVSALDVSVKGRILELLDRFASELELTIVLISHDVATVRQVCDRVGVMYLGRLVEVGPTESVLRDPSHPYTAALLDAVPDPTESTARRVELTGDVPSPRDPPTGCSFHTRCHRVIPPDDLDCPPDVFRRVFTFRMAVAHGRVPETIDDPATLREEYDLPSSIPDPRGDDALTDAISQVCAGERDAAAARLAEVFDSPCERTDPDHRGVGDGHRAACLRRTDTTPSNGQ